MREQTKIAKIATKMNNIIDMPYGKTEVKAIEKKISHQKVQERWDRETTGIIIIYKRMCMRMVLKGKVEGMKQ